MTTYCTRMIWPNTTVPGTQTTVNGRTYTAVPGLFDAVNWDVAGLVTAGAIVVCQSGAIPAFQAPSVLGLMGMPATGLGSPSNPYALQSGIQGANPGAQGNIALIPDVSPVDPFRPITITATAGIACNTGQTKIGLNAAIPGMVAGLKAADTTTPSAITGGQTVSSFVTPTGVLSATLTGSTTTSSAVLNVNIVPPGITAGMLVKDVTTPADIAGMQTVSSFTTPGVAGTVTMSGNATVATGASDSIQFLPAITISANLNAAINNGDVLTFAPAIGTVYMDVALNKLICWDGSYWRDAWSNAIV